MNTGLLRMANGARAFVVWAVVLGLLGAAVTVAQMTLLAVVVSRMFVGGAGLESLRWPLVLLFGAVALRPVLLWLGGVVARRGAVRAKFQLRQHLFAHVMKLGPGYSSGEHAGELTTTAVEGVERLDPYFARYLPQVYLSALVPLVVAGYVLALDALSGVILLATGPAIPVLMALIGGHTERHTRDQWEALSRMGALLVLAVGAPPIMYRNTSKRRQYPYLTGCLGPALLVYAVVRESRGARYVYPLPLAPNA